MDKKVKATTPKNTPKPKHGLTDFDLELIKFRQENPIFYRNHIEGLAESGGRTNIDYKGTGFEKAAKGYKSSWWKPFDKDRGSWAKWNMPDNMATKAFEQQSFGEILGDTVIGFGKRFGAGFIDSIGAWDAVNMTAMAMDRTDVDYSNLFNRLGAKITKNANEENQIYQDPTGGIWNGAYLANHVQQLGYTGGIIAEMAAENALLDWATGGTQNLAAVGKIANLRNLATKAAVGMFGGVKEAHMNALETQNNVYEKFKALGYSEEQALKKSREAANLHFKTEASTLAAVNGLQNMILMGAFNKTLGNQGVKQAALKGFQRSAGKDMAFGFSDAVSGIGESMLKGITKNKLAHKIGGYAFAAGSEAIEEGIQTGIGMYSERSVQGLNTSWADLWRGHEMRDSMIGGALGGVLMAAGFRSIEKYNNKKFNKQYKEGLENMANFSARMNTLQDVAQKNFQDAAKAYQEKPTPENRLKLEQVTKEAEKARHNFILSSAIGSLAMDYGKGEGTTHMFDMQIETMKKTLEAIENNDMEFLKGSGFVDHETGKIRQDRVALAKQTYQKNIDDAYKMRDFMNDNLQKHTKDFSTALHITQAQMGQMWNKETEAKQKEELQGILAKDQVYAELKPESQRRFLLESERAGLLRATNQDHTYVKERLKEIEAELEALPEFTIDEKKDLIDRNDNVYAEKYANIAETKLAVFDDTKEIAKRTKEDYIKEKVKEYAERRIEDAKTEEEVEEAVDEASVKGATPKTVLDKAAEKIKGLRKKKSVEDATGVPIANPPKPSADAEGNGDNNVVEKTVKPSTTEQAGISLFSGANAGKFTSTTPEVEDISDEAIADELEFFSEDRFKDGSLDEEIKEKFEPIYNELSERLGKKATHNDLVKRLIEGFGKEDIQKILPGLERASELLGREVTDTSHFFNAEKAGVDFLLSQLAEENNKKPLQYKPEEPGKVEDFAVERGTSTGANKLAIYNDHDPETGKYRQAEELVGEPSENTLRYTLKVGDKLIMSLAPDFENAPVLVLDRRNNNPHKSDLRMTFGEFMEWITTDACTEYGYTKVEKNSEGWHNYYQAKAPMVYYATTEAGEPTTDIVAYVHDVEWWHRNNVSQISEKSPEEIAKEGRTSAEQERKRFFQEGKKETVVQEISPLGTMFNLQRETAPGSGVYESNVNTGETKISLEDATGETRIGYIDSVGSLVLQDGTTISIGEKHEGTNQPILLNVESFISKNGKVNTGAIIEVRKVRDINGKPVYIANYTISNNTSKGEPLHDTTFNIAKQLILSKIFESTTNPQVRELLSSRYGINPTTIQQLNSALDKAKMTNLKGNFNSIMENFIRTHSTTDPSKPFVQFSFAPKFMKIQQGSQEFKTDYTSGVEKITNFLDQLLEGDNPLLRQAVPHLNKSAMTSNGEMFTVDNEGNIKPFESKHGENTYAGYMKSVVQSNIKSFPTKEVDEEGKPLGWITDVQPMVYVTNKVEILKNETQETATPVSEVEETDINDEATLEDPELDSEQQDVNDMYKYLVENETTLREVLGNDEYERQVTAAANSNTFDSNSEFYSRNMFSDEQAEMLNILRIPGVSNKELSHIADFLFNSILATMQSSENRTIKPRILYDRLMSSPEQFLTSRINEDKQRAENLRKLGTQDPAMLLLIEKYEANVEKLNAVVKNKEILLERLKLQLDELLGIEFKLDSISEGYYNEEGEYVNDIFNEDFLYGEEVEADYSKMGIEKDIKLTYSTALKIAFAGIEAVDLNGWKVGGEFGLPRFFNIGEVSDLVKALVVGVPSNTTMMLEELNTTASQNGNNKMTQVIAREMYNRLSQSPEHVKNELVYKLAQQKLNMEMIIYSADETGRYTLKVQNTNSNSESFRLREQWRNNFSQGPFVTTLEDGTTRLNKEYLQSFYDRITNLSEGAFERIKAGEEKKVKEELYNILQDLGVTVGKNTFEALYEVGGKVSLLVDKKNLLGLVSTAIKPLLAKQDTQLGLDNEENLFLEKTISGKLNFLAGLELRLNSIMATPSQRIAGKSFPGTSMRVMLDDIVEQLMNKDSVQFDFLKRVPYSQRNFLLNLIENTNFVSLVNDNYTRVSPVTIREQGKQIFGDLSIDKLSDTDHMLSQIAFFIDNMGKSIDTGNATIVAPGVVFRVGKMFSPSLSDKGQMVAISTALMDLKSNNFVFGEDGKVELDDNVLSFMLTNVFESEWDRIVHSYKNKTNIKNYDDANKYFIAIHEFNNIEIGEISLEEALRVHHTSEYDTPEQAEEALQRLKEIATPKAKEILKSVIEANLAEKISQNADGEFTGTWASSGIFNVEEEKLKHIDSKFIDSKIVEGTTLTELQKAKVVALDFIANQYLFQSNIYQLYIGDLALYAPGKKAYIDAEGNLDSYALSKATLESVNKRVAALIAPGSVLADSVLDNGMPKKYTQVFVNDVKGPSSILEDYIRMTNEGKLSEDNKKLLEEYASEDPEVRKKALESLKGLNPVIAEYFDIEGTDAQEYTTWKEHLDLLLGQGRILVEDYDRISQNLREGKDLQKEDLKIILNPVKPVYAGTIMDETHMVNRFVYVKSSSFPLLPQLTKDFKLDKVRIALEKLEAKGKNVRMSYQTANKVGAITTTLNMSDFYEADVNDETALGNFLEAKVVPNTLELNRNSFKVQQDTPYKAKKYNEKGEDTHTTMGSQIDKYIMGAGINKMGKVFSNIFPASVLEELGIANEEILSGADLDAIKTHIQTEYMKLQQANLEKEIGLEANQDYNELPEAKRKEVFKKLVNVLEKEIKTRQYDKALLKELEIDETGLQTRVPIWLTNNADKFESLFLSIVKNRFIAIKLPGNGHIVGSSEGFERVETFNELSAKYKSGITWLNPNHRGDLKATYITNAEGKRVVSESEVLIQSHYTKDVTDPLTGKTVKENINLLEEKNEDGSLKYVEKIGEDYVLKPEMLDTELRSMFSFRIPTSAHQSGAILKVVGFLPVNSGDLLIVPDEHTKQIGEDFDIDKRFVYKSNYFVGKDGAIKKVTLDNFKEYRENNDILTREERIKILKEELSAHIGELEDENSDLYEDVKYLKAQAAQDESLDKLMSAMFGSEYKTKAELYEAMQTNRQLIAMLKEAYQKEKSSIRDLSEKYLKRLENSYKKLGLENAMIDIYKSVYTSPSYEVQQKIFRILSMDVADKTAAIIDEAINVVDKKNFTVLSDDVQRKLLKSGTSGKLGTALHSIAVTLQAQMERLPVEKRLVIRTLTKDGTYEPKIVRLGSYVSDGVLGMSETLDGAREIGAIHAENQNSAVDNVKANIMAKRNENLYTMPVLIQLAYRGFDQDTLHYTDENGKSHTTKVQLPSLFLAQPILRRYVQLLEESQSITADFVGDREAQVLERLEKEFAYENGLITFEDVELFEKASKKMTATELYKNLPGTVETTDNFLQLAVLKKFLELKAEAEQMTDIQRVMTLSTGGLGKSYFDVLSRIEALDSLPDSSVQNAAALIGESVPIDEYYSDEKYSDQGYIPIGMYAWKPTTTEGAMLLYSLKNAVQIMDVNYPYNRNLINRVLEGVVAEKGVPLKKSNSTEFKWKVLKSLKDAIFSSAELGYFLNDINAERARLFENGKDKESLGKYLSRIKQAREPNGTLKYPMFNTNALLRSLDLHVDKKIKNNVNIIKHANLNDQDLGVISKNEHFLQMLDDNTTSLGTWNGEKMTPRKLAQDLASYAYLANQENGAVGFRQFIDMDYLKSIGYDTKLKEVLDRYQYDSGIISTFVKQYYQHNPEQAKIFSSASVDLSEIGAVNEGANAARNKALSSQGSKNYDANMKAFFKALTSFTYTGDEHRPKFIAIRDTSVNYTDNKFKLFELTSEDERSGEYQEIPTLGSFGLNEYNLDNYDQRTMLSKKVFQTVAQAPIQSFSGVVEDYSHVRTEDVYKAQDARSLLQTLQESSSNEGILKTLALLEDYIDPSTKVVVQDLAAKGKRTQAYYDYEDNVIYLDSKAFYNASTKTKYSLYEAKDIMDQALTEELLHSVQVKALFEHGEYKEGVFTPNRDAPIAVTKLVKLYEEARQALPDDYESKNIVEFMAGVFDHRSEYREKLDNIKDSKGLSLFDKIKNALGQLMQFLTNNYTAEVKQTVIELMDMQRNKEGQKGQKGNPLGKFLGPEIKLGDEAGGPVQRPIIDKSKVKGMLDNSTLRNDVQNVMKNIPDIASLTPENLLSLLQEKGIVKRECN